MLCSYFASVSHHADKPLNRENATGVPSLEFLQALEIIEASASGVTTDQPTVKTVKALVTLGRPLLCWRRFGIRIFRGAIPQTIAGLKAKLPKDFLHVHTAEEFDLFAHQLQEYVFALRADCR